MATGAPGLGFLGLAEFAPSGDAALAEVVGAGVALGVGAVVGAEAAEPAGAAPTGLSAEGGGGGMGGPP